MLNFKKRLLIEIEDPTIEDEEDIQLYSIKKETSQINFQEYQMQIENQFKFYEEERHKILEVNNIYINQVLFHMEKENVQLDLSYKWISRINAINDMARSIFISPKNIDKLMNKRDVAKEYKLIKIITEDSRHKENLIIMERRSIRNNRYSDIIPYQNNIASICDDCNSFESVSDENYINASYIDGPISEDFKTFIATQGPLPNTISKFWKLILSKNVKLIVMLCNLMEEGRKKCDCYWPTIQGTTKQIDDNLEVFLEREETVFFKSLIKREFVVRHAGIEKRVTQMQMINWDDHCAPDMKNCNKVIEYMINAVNEVKNVTLNTSPVLVHCSAGTGRTGTFIALYNIIRSFSVIKYNNLTNEIKVKPFFSVFNTVRKLREQRMLMVTSLAQYKYIYEMAIDWAKRNMEMCEKS